MAGFVYIMSNPAFPDLLKIGKSKKDPTTDRVNELNQTGVPAPFKVEYYAFVENEDFLERAVHAKLQQYRPQKNREFFKIDCLLGIKTIQELSAQHAKIKYEEVFYISPEELAKIRAEDEKQKEIDRLEMERLTKERELEETRLREMREEELRVIREQKELRSAVRYERLKPSILGALITFIIAIFYMPTDLSALVALLVGGTIFALIATDQNTSGKTERTQEQHADKNGYNLAKQMLVLGGSTILIVFILMIIRGDF